MTKVEYIKQMYKILSEKCAEYGYNNVAAGMVAQSIQEGWNSGLATKYHNYWGMKAGSSYKGPTVAMDNKQKTDPAVYRTYTSMEEGCDGYFVFLSYPRYQPLRSCQTDGEFLDKIGPLGWNKNNGYGDRCKAHLKDVYTAIAEDESYFSLWEIGKTYSTTQDLYIREEPNGEKKNFEDITENAQANGMADEWGKAILNRGSRVTVK